MEFKAIDKGIFLIDLTKNHESLDHPYIGIDIGQYLTKYVYANSRLHSKLTNEDGFVELEYLIVKTLDLETSCKYVRSLINVPADVNTRIKVTGSMALHYKSEIESIMEAPIEMINKKDALEIGVKSGLDNIGLKKLKLDPVKLEDNQMSIDSAMIDQFVSSFRSRINETAEGDKESNVYPCIVYNLGNFGTLMYINEKQEITMYQNIGMGGAEYMGLAKCLVDDNDYEICTKKSQLGNRKNVDTLVKDMLNDDPNSPYGKFPPDLPIMVFGGCMDRNVGRETLAGEDILDSLCSLVMENVWPVIADFCRIYHTDKVYIMGNMLQSQVFQRNFEKQMSYFPGMFTANFLNFGFCRALGAFLY